MHCVGLGLGLGFPGVLLGHLLHKEGARGRGGGEGWCVGGGVGSLPEKEIKLMVASSLGKSDPPISATCLEGGDAQLT